MDVLATAPSDRVAAAYTAARERRLIVEHPSPGVLRLSGAGTLDFLHRMSTNDLSRLEPGATAGTVLTTAIGRTVDVVRVFRRASDVLLLTTSGREAAVQAWLGRYIFFNDDVRVERSPETFHLWGIYGPASELAVEELNFSISARAGQFTDASDSLAWRIMAPIDGYQLLAAGSLDTQARQRWGAEAAEPGVLEAYEAIRIEVGHPAVGREIDEDVVPLEVGLWDLVSFSKGCYIGQEVIARMESRSRIARRLVGVGLSRPEATPQEVRLEGQPIGRLTSTALSPRFGPIGLALVRAIAVEGDPGNVALSPSGGTASIRSLPFERSGA